MFQFSPAQGQESSCSPVLGGHRHTHTTHPLDKKSELQDRIFIILTSVNSISQNSS